jgi:hypothetical protein
VQRSPNALKKEVHAHPCDAPHAVNERVYGIRGEGWITAAFQPLHALHDACALRWQQFHFERILPPFRGACMPHYLFRPCPTAPAAVRQRSLPENLEAALAALHQLGIDVTHDSDEVYIETDAAGERIALKVGTKDSIGWHLSQIDLLSRNGVIVTRVRY